MCLPAPHRKESTSLANSRWSSFFTVVSATAVAVFLCTTCPRRDLFCGRRRAQQARGVGGGLRAGRAAHRVGGGGALAGRGGWVGGNRAARGSQAAAPGHTAAPPPGPAPRPAPSHTQASPPTQPPLPPRPLPQPVALVPAPLNCQSPAPSAAPLPGSLSPAPLLPGSGAKRQRAPTALLPSPAPAAVGAACTAGPPAQHTAHTALPCCPSRRGAAPRPCSTAGGGCCCCSAPRPA